MKTIIFLSIISSLAISQGDYKQGKIDMHGGNYDSFKSSKKKSFGSSGMGMSMFLDKNSTKNIEKKKD